MSKHIQLVGTALVIVRAGRVLNVLALAAIAVALVATWAAPGFYLTMLARADPRLDPVAGLQGIRLLMLVGLVEVVAIDRLLGSLSQLVASAGQGDPFAPDNAVRLRRIGWALLVLQLLDLPCTLLARFWPSLGSAAPAGGVSVGGWLATLMVFVLAQAFAAGAAMRADLDGTV